ncbi:MAG TPA: murein biosynthesis integral membrane protein MurJ [Actinomycetota bacterium]|jgi:putative peptidoglycan lipid II flippase
MGEEVRPTSDLLTPDAAGLPEDASEDAAEQLVRHTAVMSVGTALSRLTGFLRLSAASAALGANLFSDAYNTANITPNIIYELVLGGILTSVFVPVFVEWLHKHGRDEAWAVADRVLTLALVSLAAIAALGALLAPAIMRLYYAGAPAATREASIETGAFFLRWFMPQIVFYGVGAVAGGLLTAHRRFAPVMFTPILNNLAVVCTFVAFAIVHQGDVALGRVALGERILLAVGTTLGVLAMSAALWPSLRRMGYRWHLRFDWKHPAVRRLARLAAWVVVYVAANQVAYLVVLVLSNQREGWITTYQYAFILFQLPHAIFAVSIFTALLPGMSGRWAAEDVDGVRRLLSQGLRSTAFIVLPAAAGYVALASPIVRLLLQRGQTTNADATLIAETLQAFALGLAFFSTFQLLSRAFYSMQDTRTPALVNVGAAALNIGVNVALVHGLDLGVQGLALGHAISYVFSTSVCLLILRARLGGIDGRRVLRTLAIVTPAAIATGIAAWGAAHAVGAALAEGTTERVLQVTAGVGAGLLVYGSLTLILRMEEADYLKMALVRRFRR